MQEHAAGVKGYSSWIVGIERSEGKDQLRGCCKEYLICQFPAIHREIVIYEKISLVCLLDLTVGFIISLTIHNVHWGSEVKTQSCGVPLFISSFVFSPQF